MAPPVQDKAQKADGPTTADKYAEAVTPGISRRTFLQKSAAVAAAAAVSGPSAARAHQQSETRPLHSVQESIPSTPHLLADAIRRAEAAVGGDARVQLPNHAEALRLAEILPGLRKELVALAKYFDGCAGVGPEGALKVAEFSRERGFRAVPARNVGPNDISVLSVHNVCLKWLVPPREGTLQVENGNRRIEKNAVRFAANALAGVFRTDDHPHPVAALKTRSGERVFITKYSDLFNVDHLELQRRCWKLKLNPDDQEYSGAIVPMVDFKQTSQVPSLNGARVGDRVIGDARLQTNLQLDQNGFGLQASLPFTLSRSSDKRPLVTIDGPFVIFIKTTEGLVPCAATIRPDDMKRPQATAVTGGAR